MQEQFSENVLLARLSLLNHQLKKLRSRTLRRSTCAPGLPQVTPLVCGDDLQACGKAEADGTNERVRKSDCGQIQVR
jgi:hypothetical protein